MVGVVRTQAELLKDYRRRLTALERRLASRSRLVLPDRLGRTSQQVVDWNQAVASGFYWSAAGAANSPFDAVIVGRTEAASSGYLIQIVHRAGSTQETEIRREWRRRGSIATGIFTPWYEINADTGPVDLSSYALTGGALTGRRVGKVVEIKGTGFGSAPSSAIPDGATTELWTALPAEWRPPAGSANSWGVGFFNSYQFNVCMRPAGTGAVGNRTGVAASNLQFSVMFFQA